VSFVDWWSTVSGTIGVLAACFSFLVWYHARSKVQEMARAMQSIHDIAIDATVDSQIIPEEDDRTRLKHLEQSIAKVSNLRHITGKYAHSEGRSSAEESAAMLEGVVPRAWLWSSKMLLGLETEQDVRQVWLVTPDLEPDLSEHQTGETVRQNLRAGKSYTYFYPAALPHAEEQCERLLRNVGAVDQRRRKRIVLVPLDPNSCTEIMPALGNIVLYFKEDPRYTRLVFQEVVLNKVTRRGSYWQECTRDHANALCLALSERLRLVSETA